MGWVPCLNGYLAAAGAPSPHRLKEWKAQGATDILTLQRLNEMRSNLAEDVRALGLNGWHRPLSGRRLEASTDRDSLSDLGPILEILKEPGRGLVLHCSAGLHRTGLVFFLLLRSSGLSLEDAVSLIRESRPLTAEELLRRTRKNGVLLELAEDVFQSQKDALKAE